MAQNDTTTLPEVSDGKFTPCFVNLNEGYNGDFNPKNPKDKNLLRIDVLVMDEKGEWYIPQDASACTGISAEVPASILIAFLRRQLKDLEEGRNSPGGIASTASWVDDEDLVTEIDEELDEEED